ncbi:C2 domain [Arabidopsis thaliana x Arabidopsis arenosa]|uniref:C2 domain n=1 Tax=Arabidopsis thaliana x Arabidopsis arenosa TaxID=1240361 RepID=A0A8T1Y6L1_9BRAS|nr:C2 domain [Arabidopsis thaliana x Arabidopsis arenosa]
MSSPQLQRAMENPTLELKIVSASDVNHIDATDKMDVYAVVSINGDTTQQKQAAKTPIDYDGGSNPTWNHTVKFSVNEREANEGLLTITVKLFSYWLDGDNDLYLGEVNISVQELLASNPIPPFTNGNINKMKSMTCPIKATEESTKATVSLSYRFKPVPVEEPCPPSPDYSPSIGKPVYRDLDPAKLGQPLVFSPRFQSTTGKLILELVIKFAKNIEDVNAFSSMDVYASVAILKDRKVKNRVNTPVAFAAYTNPTWNQKMKFSLDEKSAQEGRLMLLVELMSHRPFLGDKEIGFVRLPMQQLLGSNPPYPLTNSGDANGMKLETHALTGPYGKKGVVSFTYRFLAEQVTAPPPSTPGQQYIMYLPVSPQSYASSDQIQVTSSYVTVQPGAGSGPSNGLVPIYMPPTYQSHGYQQYSPRKPNPQPQLPPQQSQLQPLRL